MISKQREVLIGGLLGDASLELSGKMRTPRLRIERSYRDIKYLQWQHNIFKDLCSSDLRIYSRFDRRYNKTYQSCYLRTKQLHGLLLYHKQWYPNGKRVPHNVKLTPLTLAVWFADDGCIVKEKNSHVIKFSTESFPPEDVDFLRGLLRNLTGQHFAKYKKKNNQYIIKSGNEAALAVIKIIKGYLLKMGMERKIPEFSPCYSKKHFELFTYIKDHTWCTYNDLVHIYNNKDGLYSRLNHATKKGLLRKKKDAVDGRIKRFALTTKGIEALQGDNIVNLRLFASTTPT